MKFYDIDRQNQPPPEMDRGHGGLSPIHAQEPMKPEHSSMPEF